MLKNFAHTKTHKECAYFEAYNKIMEKNVLC